MEPGTRDAIAGVTAIAIERTQLLEERKEAELVRRGADLKSALLASLSHDLKTPLTAVTVAASNLDASWLTAEQRHEQTAIVRAELDRLNRLFQNIVDLARIETHAVAAEREWVQPAEIVEAAVGQVACLADHVLEMDAAAEGALVRLDPRLTSAALVHVLENAGQYSPPGSTIAITVTLESDELHVAVRVTSCDVLSLKIACAVNCCDVPFAIVGVVGLSWTETSVGAVTVRSVVPVMPDSAALIVVVPVASALATPTLVIVAVV
jgi:two-component system sensor histidine kinase KdpD